MDYYLKNGFLDMRKIINEPYPFIFVIHGRGTGKTYGAIDTVVHDCIPFLYMRRTQVEADLVSSEAFSPFKPLMVNDPDLHIVPQKIPHVKNAAAIYKGVPDEHGKYQPDGDPIGYSCALSTVASIRGLSLEDVVVCIFDEFIPERSARPIKNEGEAFLNAYETFNRNRELTGRDPLKMVCLSNSNTLASPILYSMGLMRHVEKMAATGQEVVKLPQKGVALFLLHDSPVSAAKQQTALYKAIGTGAFSDMAISNAFDSSTWLYVEVKPLQEYKPLFAFEDVCVYQHKSRRGEYYVARKISGSPSRFTSDKMSVKRMKTRYSSFFEAWIAGRASFQDYYCKYLLLKYM